ncbi:MAG TPA: DUF2202 domain-containing protein [Candidatus Limiplasma sp.]|nr:DUF2202 domain-containing protein [Candidatus Limiplasma sp.]
MKHTMKILAVALALAVLPTLSLAQDAFGSAAVDGTQTYTLQEMLTYAMQDEYMAEAEYIAIQETFGVNNPYTNIIKAEGTHQSELAALFENYGIEAPANTAADNVVLPATLQETYETGVAAEIANIAMYQTFLAQSDVPDDVRAVFEDLMNASQSHLDAFTRNAEKTGTGTGNGKADGTQANQSERGNQSADQSGRGSGNQNVSGSNSDCDGDCDGDCDAAQTSQTQQGRGGKNHN